MVFSSVTFLVYFLPVVLLLYFVTPRVLRNWFLLVASIMFYSWGAPRFIFVILFTTMIDFWLVGIMDRAQDEKKRKLLLLLPVCMNLGLLFYFKYCNFFIENVNAVLLALGLGPMGSLNVLLPIGISFYTFESLTYVIGVYRRVHAPLKNFWNYQLYIIFFPKLIAGPIVKYHDIADQIVNRLATDNAENKLRGFYRFVTGLAKKVFIANYMARHADAVFGAAPEDLSAVAAWVGVIAYTFQIYFDFSGYSDMAIGLARMFGFVLPENFEHPYTSRSITEFWRRWHISLGSWMREYLYVPLGGNRVSSRTRLYFNLWVVFLASGLWHGASWTFVLWGAYHGLFLVLERMFLLKWSNRAGLLAVPVTFLVVCVGWVFFRSDTIPQAFAMIERLFAGGAGEWPGLFDREAFFYFSLAFFFSFFAVIPAGMRAAHHAFYGERTVARLVVSVPFFLLLLVAAIGCVASTDFNPFIYFRF